MERRNFIKAGGALAALSGLGIGTAHGFIPAHNWDKYDFGSGPAVKDRLYQGPFPQYSLEPVVPGSEVVMTTTPSKEVVPNFGMGLTVYISGDLGPPRLPGETLEKSIEDLVKLPFVQKMYIRPNWREMQNRPGRLDVPEYWKIIFDLSKRYDKRICTRIMLENPDGPELGMPDFLMDKVPYVKLHGEWNRGNKKDFRMPRYDNPAYQAAFRELVALLAEELNGNPQVEYMDTFMYGFW
ncbi:MAG TPA: twin-arginine translocation signal domain-containing protein, partial [Bacteroidales bacterium]